MNPTEFEQANATIAPPPGEPNVRPLRCYRDERVVISAWEPTPEERAAIAAGGPIYVTVFFGGVTHRQRVLAHYLCKDHLRRLI